MDHLFKRATLILSPIYADMKPSKPLCRLLIAPWVKVVSEELIEDFSRQKIVPKLSYLVSKLELDP